MLTRIPWPDVIPDIGFTRVNSDDFNRADASTLGSPWTRLAGVNANILNNQVFASSTSIMRYAEMASNAPVYAECLTTLGGNRGPMIAANTNQYSLFAVCNSNILSILQIVAGNGNFIGSSTSTIPLLSNNTVQRLRIFRRLDGKVSAAYMDTNGAWIIPPGVDGLTANSDLNAFGTGVGFYFENTLSGNYIDDWAYGSVSI